MEWPIVTLTTDWGDSDFFAGMVKGRLMREIPNVRIVDITHKIAPQDLSKTIFIVKHGCLNFPPGTIHIIDVDSHQDAEQEFIVVEYNQQYYICTNNGLPYLLFGDKATQAVMIDIPSDSSFHNFVALDLFCKVAAAIANESPLSSIGPELDQFVPRVIYSPNIKESLIEAHIIYIDTYGNCYLNITYQQFEKTRNNRKFTATVRYEYKINKIVYNYHEQAAITSANSYGLPILLTVSATGLLELVICKSNTADLIGLREGEKVIIQFE